MKILVTGSTGFVGQALCPFLEAQGHEVVRTARQTSHLGEVQVGTIGAATNWRLALANCEAVVHLAARVHVMHEKLQNPLAEFREINVNGALNLAHQAAKSGVKRFVFLSSIKVNGEETLPARPFSSNDVPQPRDAYAISKWEAEQGLLEIAADTGMEVVVIRPPLVYGPGVKANFLSLMKWLNKGLPLPLGKVTENRRSFIAIDNLVDLIATCLFHPNAAGRTFLASDGEDLSTTQLLQRLAHALGKPARLIPVPPTVLHKAAAIFGKEDVVKRLIGNLQVDTYQLRELLNWTAPISVDDALRRCAKELKK